MPPANRQEIKGSTETEYALREKNICHLLFQHTSGQIELKNPIPTQSIRIVGQRIAFANSTAAQANPLMYLMMAPIGPSQANTNLIISAIPLVFDSQVVDSFNEIQYSMTLSSKMPNKFSYSIVDENGTLIPDSAITFVQIIFEFEIDNFR